MPSLRMRCGGLVYDRNGLPGRTAGPVDRPKTQALIHHASCINVAQGPGCWESQGLPVEYFLASPATPAVKLKMQRESCNNPLSCLELELGS